MLAPGKVRAVLQRAMLDLQRVWVVAGLLAAHPALASEPAVPPGQLFPVIIRVGEEAFNDERGDVEEQSPVETCVLGTQNRGHALVRGKVLVDLVEAPTHARLALTFQGTSTSYTTARQGPATIYSTTVSRFS